MIRSIVSRAWVFLLFPAVLLAFVSVGCVDVQAPKDVSVDVPDYYNYRYERDRKHKKEARHDRKDHRERREEPKRGKLKKDEAKDIAKDLAASEGVDVGRFDIKDKEIDGVYWILFEREHQGRGRRGGWRDHFAVRVARGPRGKTRATLYKGGRREDYSSDMDEDKVEKDEAYKYAKAMARKCGVNPGEYEIHDKKFDDNYWVLFENRHPGPRQGWRNHFAVRVSKYGIGEMYK